MTDLLAGWSLYGAPRLQPAPTGGESSSHSLPGPSCRPEYLRHGVGPEARNESVSGRDATLVVWSPDYDGQGKAWVRFDDGTGAIVGGSHVER